MYRELPIEMIRFLLSNANWCSAQEIADQLCISRRTVFNNMKAVREICEKYDAKLCVQKTKGYQIIESARLEWEMKKDAVVHPYPSNQEHKLYIMYLLLHDEEPIRISELERIMYLSRPTIYKFIKELKEWFAELEMELILSQKGVYLEYGERRYRQALKNWIIEVQQIIEEKSKKQDFSDYYKLQAEKAKYETIKEELLYQSIAMLCQECHIYCSKQEMENLTVLLRIMIYRNAHDHFVKMSTRQEKNIELLYSQEKKNKATQVLQEILHISFPSGEIVYLLTNLLVNADFENREALDNSMQNIEIHEGLMQKIEEYLRQVLVLPETAMQELLEEVQRIIKRELLFIIKGNYGISAHYYDVMMNRFNKSVEIWEGVFARIQKYYDIAYHEKMGSNFIFTLLGIIEKNKKPLRVAWFHDCNQFEYQFVFMNLQRFPFVSLVYTSDNEEELRSFCEHNEVDLIFSNRDFHHETLDVIVISKAFNRGEMMEAIRQLNIKFQTKNFQNMILEE